jgi:hypothetical protein
MAVAYLRVTNGQQEFILRRSRRSIAEPLGFERLEGSLGQPAVSVAIQERELRKELKLRFQCCGGQGLSEAKIDRFVALFRAASSLLDARSATVTEPSYDNDNIAYAPLPATTKALLLKQCASHFTLDEVQALRRFIEAHSTGSDVMTLALRRCITVAEPVY